MLGGAFTGRFLRCTLMTIEGVGVETGYKYMSIQIPLIYVIMSKYYQILISSSTLYSRK